MDWSHSPDIPRSLTSPSLWDCLGGLRRSTLLVKNDPRLKSWNGNLPLNVWKDVC